MTRLWAALLFSTALAAAVQPGPHSLVITGGRVLDPVAGTYRAATVVIAGGRITAVQAPDARLPENASHLDATGQTIVPGLIDLDVQATPSAGLDVSYFYTLSLAYGVTSLRVVDGTLPWAVAQRDRVRKGDVLAPGLFTAGPGVSTPNAVTPGAPDDSRPDRPVVFASDPASIAREVARQARARVDWVRLLPGTPPDMVRAAVAAARPAKIRVSGSPGATTLTQLAQLRVHAIDAVDGPPQVGTATDDARLRPAAADVRLAVQALVKARVTLIPKLRLDAERSGQDEARGREAELKLLPDRLRKNIQEHQPQDAGHARGFKTRRELVKALAAQRGAIGAGSGAAREGWPVPGLALHRELSALVAAGLSPADAIRAATSTGAETLGVGNALGQVRPGFRADLLIVQGDPLADVTALREITQVVRGGEVVDRQALLNSGRRAAAAIR